MAAVENSLMHCIEDLEGWDDGTGRKRLDLESTAAHDFDALGPQLEILEYQAGGGERPLEAQFDWSLCGCGLRGRQRENYGDNADGE
jgi:hypothetical protein